jgi:hypothetical protein
MEKQKRPLEPLRLGLEAETTKKKVNRSDYLKFRRLLFKNNRNKMKRQVKNRKCLHYI